MPELPPRYRALDARAGMEVVGHRTAREALQAVKRSLPTMHHAALAFERADGGVVSPAFRVKGPADLLLPEDAPEGLDLGRPAVPSR